MAAVLTTDDLLDLKQAHEWARSGVAKMAREAAGASLGGMARALDGDLSDLGEQAAPTSPVTILRWERGERRPSGVKGAAYGRQIRQLIEKGRR